MIHSLRIEGLKSIDEIELKMKNLNILVGTNSSGKSTIIQSILLASQSFNETSGCLNGNLISLGDFREVRNFVTNAQEIRVTLNVNKGRYEIKYKECGTTEDSCEMTISGVKNDVEEELLIDKGIHYLSASRIGYRDTYEKNLSKVYKFGLLGEYCLYYFEKNKDKVLEKEIIKDENSKTLQSQVNYWFSYIVGSKLSTEDIKETDRIKAKFKSKTGRDVRTKNIGSGLSYLISIIIMALSIEEGKTLIIENPEIHLHPKAQSRLTEFFAFVSKSGRQIIIETHSDHIFNGMRVAFANKELTDDDITINFLKLDNDNCTSNQSIKISKRGRIENYIEDLFDQFEIDLDNMLGV